VGHLFASSNQEFGQIHIQTELPERGV